MSGGIGRRYPGRLRVAPLSSVKAVLTRRHVPVSHFFLASRVPHKRRTWLRLAMPSKTHVLSIGIYCLVMILIIS